MLIDAYGRNLTQQTTTRFHPQLVLMLMGLSDLLRQNGLGLFCVKCHRLGLPDGVQSDNRPESDTYRLTCACADRVFHKQTGVEQVRVA